MHIDTVPHLPSGVAVGPLVKGAPARTKHLAASQLYLVGEGDRSVPRRQSTEDERAMICLNGRWQSVRGRAISFEQILDLLIEPWRGSLTSATVSFRRGGPGRPAGLLTPGDEIPLVDGLLINAAVTQAS